MVTQPRRGDTIGESRTFESAPVIPHVAKLSGLENRTVNNRVLKRTLGGLGLVCAVPICAVVLLIFFDRSQPTEQSRKYWEKEYVSILPNGYTDFQALWQDSDVGARMFSFKCPNDMSGQQVLDHLVKRLAGYEPHETGADLVALERGTMISYPNGFDEFRFVYRKRDHRIFGMEANLDDRNEHSRLVSILDRISQRPEAD